jgi:hypothetical protein
VHLALENARAKDVRREEAEKQSSHTAGSDLVGDTTSNSASLYARGPTAVLLQTRQKLSPL